MAILKEYLINIRDRYESTGTTISEIQEQYEKHEKFVERTVFFISSLLKKGKTKVKKTEEIRKKEKKE